MANLVPAFIGPELYLPASRLLQRPMYRLFRPLHARNIHARREGIVKPHHWCLDAPRQGDFRERTPAASDGDDGTRRSYDQRVAHLTHPGCARDVDVGVRFARIGPRQNPEAEPAGLLRTARRRRHHAAEPAAHEHSSLLGYQAPDGRRPLGLLRRAGGASDHGDERAPHRRPPLPAPSPNGGCSTPRSVTRLNSSHVEISYAVFCLKKKKKNNTASILITNRIEIMKPTT